MSKHVARNTQGAHPWRATFRTVIVALIAVAAMADPIYAAITLGDPAAATGRIALALAIAGALTRVLAMPAVDEFLTRFAPWLSAAGRSGHLRSDPACIEYIDTGRTPARLRGKSCPICMPGERPEDPAEPIPGTTLDLGATEYLPHGE